MRSTALTKLKPLLGHIFGTAFYGQLKEGITQPLLELCELSCVIPAIPAAQAGLVPAHSQQRDSQGQAAEGTHLDALHN